MRSATPPQAKPEPAIMPAKGKVCKFEGLTPSLSPIR